MTEKEIYQGLADCTSFYDMAFWNSSDKKPWYYDYFSWGDKFESSKDGLTFTPSFHGYLKYDLIDTIKRKIYYIQGVFNSYSGSHISDNTLHFANSINKIEKIIRFLSDIQYGFLTADTESPVIFFAKEISLSYLQHNCYKSKSYKIYKRI